jgi:regulatory protein
MDDSQPLHTDYSRAIDLAYKAVATRERTVSELKTFLERKRIDPSAIEAAVEELTASGFVDDERYARQFAEDKRTLDLWGGGRIARDLQRRGIEPQLVEAACSTQTRADELETALVLLGQRLPQPSSDDRARDKAWRLLVRRGYEPDLAYEAVRLHERRLASRSHAA